MDIFIRSDTLRYVTFRSVVPSLKISLFLLVKCSEGKFTSYDRPLIISPGADTFSSIGLQLPYSRPSTILDTIRQTFVVRVPQITRNDESTLEDPSNDPNFNEPIIDKLKVQREEVHLGFIVG